MPGFPVHPDPARRFLRRAIALAIVGCTAANTLAAPSEKRGFGSGDVSRIDAVNSNWYYNWGLGKANTQAEFVPMFWGGYAATDANVARVRDDASITTVLGFNEPERPDQANMTVTAALDAWPKLQATGKRLVSPAPSDTSDGRAWLQSFMTGATQRGYQVDAVAFHWYGDIRQPGAASSFLSAVDWYHSKFNRPVWITEFAGMDWWNDPSKPVTMAMNLSFMQQVLPALDSRSYVERYAWWNWSSITNLVVDPSPLTTTSLGDYWTGTTYASGQVFDLKGKITGTDIYYLKGGTITDTGTTGTDVLRRLDNVSGTGTITGNSRWEIADQLLRVRAGSILRKQGANLIALRSVAVVNDGSFAVNEGTLQFEDGATGTGAGTYRIEPGATLSFANRGSAVANAISNAVELHGGTLRAANASQVVASNISFTAPSNIDAIGDLSLTGVLSGSASVTKTGDGVLRITSRNTSTMSGAILVNAGPLFLDKIGSSVTGSSAITVGENASLVGAALVGGAATVNGEISPGAPGTSATSEFKFAGSLTLRGIASFDLAPAGNDRLTGLGVVSLGGTVRLRPGATFDPAYLAPITLLSGTSISDRFAVVEGFSLSPDKWLAVTYSTTAVRLWAALPGDATLDGVVNFDDLLALAQNYQATGRSWIDGDFDQNGTVGFDDLLTLAQRYSASGWTSLGKTDVAIDFALARSMLPEPTVATILAGIAWATRRRRAAQQPQ